MLRDPAEITLAEVMSVSDGQLGDPTSSANRETPATHVLQSAWQSVAVAEREMLESITLADLAEKATGETKNMYYI